MTIERTADAGADAARLFGTEQTAWIRQQLDAVLLTEQFSQASFVEAFEREFAAFIGRRHAVAVNSGSTALELATRALSRARRLTAMTYPVLTVPMVPGALSRAGITPIAVDVAERFLPDPEVLFDHAQATGALTIVWTAGVMTLELCDVVRQLRNGGVTVLEDGSHAHGCTVNGIRAGTLGDVAAFSLYSTKVVTTGEGGIIVLDDDEMAEWLRRYANAGKARGSLRVDMPHAWNSRMTEMQAVVGLSCLRFWSDLQERRNRVARVYRQAGVPCVQDEVEGLNTTWYKYSVRVRDAEAATRHIRAHGGWTTARTHGPDDYGGRPYPLAGAQSLAHHHVNLPTVWIGPDGAERVAHAVVAAAVIQPA